VLDRLRTGRIFFEEVLCENLGQPDQVQRIFDCRVPKRRRLQMHDLIERLPGIPVATV
jgi:hypothetical protein